MWFRSTLLGALIFTGSMVEAQEPEQLPIPREVPPGKNELPPPRVLGPIPLLPYAPPNPLPKFGTRDVWQYFSVAPNGQFRPRVIYSPIGPSYYLYNGRPFPFTTTQPRLIQPTIVD